MTVFQEQCVNKCNSILNFNFEMKEIVGDTETYYLSETDIGKHSVVIYIYVDEAEFKIDEKWFIFEKPDYDSEHDLLNSFINTLTECMRTVAEL
jgi:hypothetical protein